MKKAFVAVVAGLIIAGASSTPTFAAEVKVQKGDSLWKVSKTHNVSINDLKKENNLKSNIVFPGQVLKINEGSSNVSKYKVVQGDTLSHIAKKKNVSVANLKSWNKLSSDLIVTGQVLTIGGTNNDAPTVAATPAPAPKQQAPAQPAPKQAQPSENKQQASTASEAKPAASSNNSSAKAWIAQRESGGSYSARNGRYVGKYQLDASYLNGDHSAANQERVADKYVSERYGSWDNAKAHWESKGWY